jgi:hypothetical protein
MYTPVTKDIESINSTKESLKELDLFLCNSNLTKIQKEKLIAIIRKIKNGN